MSALPDHLVRCQEQPLPDWPASAVSCPFHSLPVCRSTFGAARDQLLVDKLMEALMPTGLYQLLPQRQLLRVPASTYDYLRVPRPQHAGSPI